MLLCTKECTFAYFTTLVILLLPLSFADGSDDDNPMCDLNAWYQEAEAEGAFVDADPEVAAIEGEIIATLESEGYEIQVPCSVINGYEELIYDSPEEGIEEGEEEEGQWQEEEEEEEEKTQEEAEIDDGDLLFAEDFEDKIEGKKETVEEKQNSEKDTTKKETAETNKETNLRPEKNVEVSKDITKKDKAQDIVAEIKTAARSKCSVSSQRYQGVLNGCHCSKDSCSWSEIFLTRQGSAKSTAEESIHTPKTPKTMTPQPVPQEVDTESMPPIISESSKYLKELNGFNSNKLRDLEMQLLKLENRMLSDKADKNNDTASYTRLENQVLKLENELLRINASFIVLLAENAQIRHQIKNEPKGQYPALPDKNATMMSNLITDHQSRISELSNVITKQSDIIKALDEKSQLLDEQNSQLKENLGSQSDMIEGIMKHIGEIRGIQNQQKTELSDETKKLYDMISSVQDSKRNKEESEGQKDLNPPDTLGAPSDEQNVKTGAADSSIELPTGTVDKLSENQTKEKDKSSPENPKLPSTDERQEAEATTVDSKQEQKETPKSKDDKVVMNKDDVKAGEESKPVDSLDITESGKQSAIAQKQTKLPAKAKKGKVKKGKKKVTKTKGKKVVKKKTKGKKKVVKKTAKKEKTIAVPGPLYLDADYKGNRDCYSHFIQGRKRDSPLRIRPVGMTREADVFCDMKNGGWTTIMRRQDGGTDFYRDWAEYKRGFGGTYSDHWLGLELIHRLTNQGDYQLRVELTDWQRNTVHANYDLIRVESEDEGYRLHISGYSGTAGDGFLGHNGMKFSTKDRDNDLAVTDFGGSCAKRFHGGWWYNKCYKSNLTGNYYRGGNIPEGKFDGVTWKAWTGSKVSLKKVELKIKPKL